MLKTVHLIALDSLSRTMFHQNGWKIVEEGAVTPETFILFSGGEDVSPDLYGEGRHRTTGNNPQRDRIESTLFNKFLANPKVGICRGGQFLNVMSGGQMYQNVDGHLGDHTLFDTDTDERVVVTSTHHQMMRPSDKGKIIGTANESTFRQTFDHEYLEGVDYPPGSDVEIVFYEHTNSLCYQPHPEYGLKSCEEHFFEVINRYFN